MILGLDHVGVMTSDPAGAALALEVLGLSPRETGVAEQYAVACEFWQYTDDPGEVAVELVSPLTPESSVASSLKRSGPGLYHLALEVDDLAAELARMRRPGVTPLDATPCRGAREGMQVAFLYLRAPAGLLVELVQYDQPRRKPSNPR